MSKTPNATDVFVGKRVKMARLLANMSQEALGDRLDLTFQQVQKYEKGSNRISASRMQQIATILGRPVSWFFDESAEHAPGSPQDIVTQMLTIPHGLELAQSYVAIKQNSGRAVVAQVARAIAHQG